MNSMLINLKEPTLNAINSVDYNTSFDNFVKNIKLASVDVNWNDIDTSQFKCMIYSININLIKVLKKSK